MNPLTYPRRPCRVCDQFEADKCTQNELPALYLPTWIKYSLDSKLPIIPGPYGKVFFIRKLGEPFYKPFPNNEFDLDDPYNHIMKTYYRDLHDPYNKNFFYKPHIRQALLRYGRITTENDVVCHMSEINNYRLYLRKRYVDRINAGMRFREAEKKQTIEFFKARRLHLLKRFGQNHYNKKMKEREDRRKILKQIVLDEQLALRGYTEEDRKKLEAIFQKEEELEEETRELDKINQRRHDVIDAALRDRLLGDDSREARIAQKRIFDQKRIIDEMAQEWERRHLEQEWFLCEEDKIQKVIQDRREKNIAERDEYYKKHALKHKFKGRWADRDEIFSPEAIRAALFTELAPVDIPVNLKVYSPEEARCLKLTIEKAAAMGYSPKQMVWMGLFRPGYDILTPEQVLLMGMTVEEATELGFPPEHIEMMGCMTFEEAQAKSPSIRYKAGIHMSAIKDQYMSHVAGEFVKTAIDITAASLPTLVGTASEIAVAKKGIAGSILDKMTAHLQHEIELEIESTLKFLLEDQTEQDSLKQLHDSVCRLTNSVIEEVLKRVSKKVDELIEQGVLQLPEIIRGPSGLSTAVEQSVNELSHHLVDEVMYKVDTEVHTAIDKIKDNIESWADSWKRKDIADRVPVKPGPAAGKVQIALTNLAENIANEVHFELAARIKAATPEGSSVGTPSGVAIGTLATVDANALIQIVHDILSKLANTLVSNVIERVGEAEKDIVGELENVLSDTNI